MSKNTSKSDAVNAASNHPTIPNETPARTAAEQAKLDTLEKAITDDNQSSFRLAAALAEIRDAKLYQPEYKTFEEYSKKRWQYSRSYCSRLCDVHEVLTDLKESTEVVAAFKNVGQARVFVDLEKDERIQLAEKVTEAAGGKKLTAAIIAKHKKELFPDKCIIERKKPAVKVGTAAEVMNDKPKFEIIWQTVIKLRGLMLNEERQGVYGALIEELEKGITPWVEWENGLTAN